MEQPADCCPIYRLIKLFNKLSIAQGEYKNILKQRIKKIVKEEMDVISLHSSNKKTLIDFLSCLPEIMQKSMTPMNIKSGFVSTGLIDKDSKICLE